MVKSVCHCPLGIFAILGPYLKNARTKDWAAELKAFGETIQSALSQLANADLPAKATTSCGHIMRESIRFIDKAIKDGNVTLEGFKKYTGKLQADIGWNMALAARLQVESIERLLKEWRDQLGGPVWRDLYAVVVANWTTQTNNQHYLMLKEAMDPKTVEDHLIVLSVGSFAEDTLEVALTNLGQIVQDRIAAALIFPEPTPTDAVWAKTLATTDDLLAGAIEKALKSCPYGGHNHPRLKSAGRAIV
jgi:hypothetical protein